MHAPYVDCISFPFSSQM